jgi:hypothetical protein
MQARNILRQFFSTNGQPGGTLDMSGSDYSAGQMFAVQPPTGDVFEVHQLVISLESAAAAMAAADFGDSTVLTNGLLLAVTNNSGVIVDILDGNPIKKNGDFGEHLFDAEIKGYGTGNEFLTARLDFVKLFGAPLTLSGGEGEKLEMFTKDNTTAHVASLIASVTGTKLGAAQAPLAYATSATQGNSLY